MAAAEAVAHGVVISEGVNLARRLVNMPPDDLYPQTFSEEAAAVAGRTGMEIEIWDEEQLARERCHAILAVGRGSNRAPRLVILRYRGPGVRDGQPDLESRAGAVEQGLFQLVLDHEDNRGVLARQATERLPVSRTYLPTLFVNVVGSLKA